MPCRRPFSTLWLVLSSLACCLRPDLVLAQNTPPDYTFILASGFLCDQGDSAGCPANATSKNGDSYEISGAGTFDSRAKSAKAAGTFNHKSRNGTVLETGVWEASDLISFDSYGIAPGALVQRRMALGPSQMGHKNLPVLRGPVPTGGLAIFHVLLIPVLGITKTAVLQVNCPLGNVPREHSVAGIQLSFERSDSPYIEEAAGQVIFLALRPHAGVPDKTLQPEPRPGASDQ